MNNSHGALAILSRGIACRVILRKAGIFLTEACYVHSAPLRYRNVSRLKQFTKRRLDTEIRLRVQKIDSDKEPRNDIVCKVEHCVWQAWRETNIALYHILSMFNSSMEKCRASVTLHIYVYIMHELHRFALCAESCQALNTQFIFVAVFFFFLSFLIRV